MALQIEAGPAVETVVRQMVKKYCGRARMPIPREEIEQESRRIAIELLCRYDPGRVGGNMSGYLWRLVNRTLGCYVTRYLTPVHVPQGKLRISSTLRQTSVDAIAGMPGGATAEDRLARERWRERVRAAAARALERLPEEDQKPATMLFGIGCRPVQRALVAQRLGIPVRSVDRVRAKFFEITRRDPELRALYAEDATCPE